MPTYNRAMHRIRARRPFFAWIAALAILLASLLPTLSHALNLGQQLSWIEVCGAQGSKWVPAGAAAEKPGDTPAAPQALAHCPGCASQNATPGLPPPAAQTLALLALDQAPPAGQPSQPPMQRAWPTARSRAPPRFS